MCATLCGGAQHVTCDSKCGRLAIDCNFPTTAESRNDETADDDGGKGIVNSCSLSAAPLSAIGCSECRCTRECFAQAPAARIV